MDILTNFSSHVFLSVSLFPRLKSQDESGKSSSAFSPTSSSSASSSASSSWSSSSSPLFVLFNALLVCFVVMVQVRNTIRAI